MSTNEGTLQHPQIFKDPAEFVESMRKAIENLYHMSDAQLLEAIKTRLCVVEFLEPELGTDSIGDSIFLLLNRSRYPDLLATLLRNTPQDLQERVLREVNRYTFSLLPSPFREAMQELLKIDQQQMVMPDPPSKKPTTH